MWRQTGLVMRRLEKHMESLSGIQKETRKVRQTLPINSEAKQMPPRDKNIQEGQVPIHSGAELDQGDKEKKQQQRARRNDPDHIIC
ncbi:hypothetical protein TNCV_4091681 [Trichonephila clavipes]|nr:hypothetical protein TNCV_4091681 [Trichonephila clavipes]